MKIDIQFALKANRKLDAADKYANFLKGLSVSNFYQNTLL